LFDGSLRARDDGHHAGTYLERPADQFDAFAVLGTANECLTGAIWSWGGEVVDQR
jgi:hypothetical protein